MRKKKWREYFTFSKRERNVGLYLLILIVIITISPGFVQIIMPEPEKVSSDILAKLDFNFIQYEELNQPNNFAQNKFKKFDENTKSDDYQNTNTFVKNITLFEFNPNTISKEQWEQLGVSKFAAERLVNYVSKGGKFKSKSDLLKTYGFTQEDFERLEPYFKIDTIAHNDCACVAYSTVFTSAGVPEQVALTNSACATLGTLARFGEDVVAEYLDNPTYFLNNEMLVYPNPSNGNFTLNLFEIEDATITVVSITGQVVYTETGVSNIAGITLENLTPGLYLVNAEYGNGKKITKSVVIE